MINIENIFGGGLILIISYLYFSANPMAVTLHFIDMNLYILLFFLIFLIYEFLLLWLLFFSEQKRNLWWYVTGGLLIITPLIQVGNGTDFSMRASIPALFLLMTWTGEALYRKPKVKYYSPLILLLVLGSFTPIYSLNRSIYYTAEYYLRAFNLVERNPYSLETSQSTRPENNHPSSLTANLYPSLVVFDLKEIPYFVGKINNSFFFTYLANPP
jgi:hypothetical protein